MDLIYAQSGTLYEIIHEALRSTHSFKKPKPGPHADDVVGSVNYPAVDSLAKQLHELSVKQSTVEASKVATPSSQTATIFAQSSQKGNQQPGEKKKEGKKGERNQNKRNE